LQHIHEILSIFFARINHALSVRKRKTLSLSFRIRSFLTRLNETGCTLREETVCSGIELEREKISFIAFHLGIIFEIMIKYKKSTE
jgi:hypothetical protein